MMVDQGSAEQQNGNWYALRVKTRSEKLVARAAKSKGFEELVPVYRSSRRWSDRIKSLETPLFPGYVFCRLDANSWLPLLTIPGVLDFVRIGKTPVPIDPAEISALQVTARSGVCAKPWPYVGSGPKVRLDAGPLAGIEGMLVEGQERYRMIVSLTVLRRSVAVELEPEWIRQVDDTKGVISQETPAMVQTSPLSSSGTEGSAGVELIESYAKFSR